MKIKIIDSTGNLFPRGNLTDITEQNIQDSLKFSQNFARICYSEKDLEGLKEEKLNSQLVSRFLKSGHHSVFEHLYLNFYFEGIPKIMAMILNNEKGYNTSEKSARYTQLKKIDPHQKELYDKWAEIFIQNIGEVYPSMEEGEKRKIAIKKLAQENARYMTSVFTPTKMGHTLSWRQLNFLINEFEQFSSQTDKRNCEKYLGDELAEQMQEFNETLSPLKVEGLTNQTDRHLSFFGARKVEEHFGDSYSTSYLMSFAGLAQAHRHRTINYSVSDGTKLGASLGFFIPRLIRKEGLKEEWVKDLESVAQYDIPQAQLLEVNERGILEDFRSKALLRMCGHAQAEIMENTTETAKKYNLYQEIYAPNALEPKCRQEIRCKAPCVWGGKQALSRIV